MIKTYNSIEKVKGSIAQVRAEGVKLGELAEIKLRDGRSTLAEVISFSGDKVNLQIYRGTRGVSTGDHAFSFKTYAGCFRRFTSRTCI